MEEKIKTLLCKIIHPEAGKDLISGDFVEQIVASEQRIIVTLRFAKARDPFAIKLKNQAEALLKESFPGVPLTVVVKEGAAAPRAAVQTKTTTGEITHIVAIASGKGGVGKSTVTANLAISLRNMGYRVGILDADIYGPSQPKMFGVEGYRPEAVRESDADQILPAEAMGIRLISIGFFIKPTDALLWRGAMAVNALKQMIHQTRWGALDFLLVDLPPGTGDIHLSIIGEMKIDGAVVVSTPQQVAVADVVRGVAMFRNENVNIPITGIIENMAWFSPEELPNNRYYLFGHGGVRQYAEQHGVAFLGEIPIVQSIMEGADGGHPAAGIDSRVEKWYREIAEKIVENVLKKG